MTERQTPAINRAGDMRCNNRRVSARELNAPRAVFARMRPEIPVGANLVFARPPPPPGDHKDRPYKGGRMQLQTALNVSLVPRLCLGTDTRQSPAIIAVPGRAWDGAGFVSEQPFDKLRINSAKDLSGSDSSASGLGPVRRRCQSHLFRFSRCSVIWRISTNRSEGGGVCNVRYRTFAGLACSLPFC